TAVVDERTLEMLDRRRRTAVVRRRGWLVRRMLLAADVAGLVLALVLAEWLTTGRTRIGVLDARTEILAFLATIPGWVVVAKLYGLYERDEERTDHSTADDFAGVFHMVTVGSWLFLAVAWLTSVANPTFPRLFAFWLAAVTLVTCGRAAARTLTRRNAPYRQHDV